MKRALIVTASQGLGLELALISSKFNIQSQVHMVNQKGVGEIINNDAIEPDYLTDASHPYVQQNYSESYDFFVWCTGVFLQKPISKINDFELDTLIDLHYRLPIKIIRDFHTQQKVPYHFIVIASCSSWRLRNNEPIYCGLSAAKASFARNFANDLIKEMPGSKSLLVNPGGLKTPFFYEDPNVSTNGYLNQNKMAEFIWRQSLSQNMPFTEIQYLRDKTNSSEEVEPIIEYGVRSPEILTFREYQK